MSATIYWEPVNPEPEYLHTMAPSWFMECLERADMGLPHTFNAQDIPVLIGLSAAVSDDDRNPFKELIEAIRKHKQVSVWAQY